MDILDHHVDDLLGVHGLEDGHEHAAAGLAVGELLVDVLGQLCGACVRARERASNERSSSNNIDRQTDRQQKKEEEEDKKKSHR